MTHVVTNAGCVPRWKMSHGRLRAKLDRCGDGSDFYLARDLGHRFDVDVSSITTQVFFCKAPAAVRAMLLSL